MVYESSLWVIDHKIIMSGMVSDLTENDSGGLCLRDCGRAVCAREDGEKTMVHGRICDDLAFEAV